MKCPECGFVSFDDLDKCKRCGFDFVAYRRGEATPRSKLLGRLRGKATGPASAKVLSDLDQARETTQRESALRREREEATRDYLARERLIREEKAQLRRTYDRATDQHDRDEIRKQIEMLDQRRQSLSEEKKAFEVRQQALEKKLRDQTAMARLKVEQEMKQAEESVVRRREREEAEIRKMQSELEAQREKIQREREEHKRQLEAERERLAHERATLEKQKQSVQESEDAYQARIAEEQRRAREIAASLREKEEHLASERARAREAEKEAVRRQSEAEEMISHIVQRLEDEGREKGEAPPADTVEKKKVLVGVDYDSMRQQWRESLASDRKPTPEDYLAVLREGRRKAKHPAAQATERDGAPAEASENDEEIVIEETTFEEEEAVAAREARATAEPRRRQVVPKGGLIRRSIAALIDMTLLLLALGVFLVIGRLVTGSQGGSARDLVLALGLPFYILFVLLAAAYVTYVHGTYGQTLGQRLLRVRVLTTHGEELTYLTAFFRFVAACFAVGFLGMGVVWIGLDPNKQGWHDKLARTVVIRS
ncbi:MAG TPA: RDD family protein [bacterium]|nr:RDD family protein [bacterium]